MVVNRTGGQSVAEILLAFWSHAESYYVKNGQPTSELNAYKQVIRTARRVDWADYDQHHR